MFVNQLEIFIIFFENVDHKYMLIKIWEIITLK
jgi:hypothetical protein